MKLEKQRYYAFRVLTKSMPTKDEIETSIWQVIKELFGIVGASKSGFYLKEFNPKNGEGIARIALAFQEEFEATLARIHEINNNPIIIETLLCSGTLKALNKHLRNNKQKPYE